MLSRSKKRVTADRRIRHHPTRTGRRVRCSGQNGSTSLSLSSTRKRRGGVKNPFLGADLRQNVILENLPSLEPFVLRARTGPVSSRRPCRRTSSKLNINKLQDDRTRSVQILDFQFPFSGRLRQFVSRHVRIQIQIQTKQACLFTVSQRPLENNIAEANCSKLDNKKSKQNHRKLT